jgi:hypothetical protein
MFERLYYQESRAEAQDLVHQLLDAEQDAFDPSADLGQATLESDDREVDYYLGKLRPKRGSNEERALAKLNCTAQELKNLWWNAAAHVFNWKEFVQLVASGKLPADFFDGVPRDHQVNHDRRQESLDDEIPDLMAYATKAARKPWGYMVRLPAFMEMNGKKYPRRDVWLNARRLDFQQYIGNGTVFKRQSTTKQWPDLQAVAVYEDPRKYGDRVLDPNFVPPPQRRHEGLDDEFDPSDYARSTINIDALAHDLGLHYQGLNTADPNHPMRIWNVQLDPEIQMRIVVSANDPTRANIFFYRCINGKCTFKSCGAEQNVSVNRVRAIVQHWETDKARFQESLDDEIRDLKAYAMQNGLPPRIKITFNKVTPESAENGDFSESGWIDEEGVPMIPDELDMEEGKTAVDLAVEYLWREGASTESSSHFNPGDWYSSGWSQNCLTGEETEHNYHLEGFTPEQEREIFDKLTAKRRQH